LSTLFWILLIVAALIGGIAIDELPRTEPADQRRYDSYIDDANGSKAVTEESQPSDARHERSNEKRKEIKLIDRSTLRQQSAFCIHFLLDNRTNFR